MMNNTLVGIIAFSAGAAIGTVVTWKLLKTKYERIAQEEIDSVKEVFAKRKPIVDEQAATIEEPKPRKVDILRDAYKNLVDRSGYANITDDDDEDDPEKPYVISPDEFATLDDYDVVCLTHYNDGVLAEDYGSPIEDVDHVVGRNYASHFGEYEDDSDDIVYVRNPRLRVDYEIQRDLRDYSDVMSINPHLMED